MNVAKGQTLASILRSGVVYVEPPKKRVKPTAAERVEPLVLMAEKLATRIALEGKPIREFRPTIMSMGKMDAAFTFFEGSDGLSVRFGIRNPDVKPSAKPWLEVIFAVAEDRSIVSREVVTGRWNYDTATLASWLLFGIMGDNWPRTRTKTFDDLLTAMSKLA